MSELSFQTLNPDQAGQVEKFARQIWPQVYADMISAEQIAYMLDWMYDPARIREEIETGGITYLLLKWNRETAGFAAFGTPDENGTAFIHKIYVAPEHHRKGLASATLTEIERQTIARSGQMLELRVNRTNRAAIQLYRKTGFEITAEDCADIGGGFVMDDYVFTKELIHHHSTSP